MALSASTTKVLEQVRMGLCMLKGAEYFTEDEWIKLDGIFHKGRYVFTNGPPNIHILDKQELMWFDEPTATSSNDEPSEVIAIEQASWADRVEVELTTETSCEPADIHGGIPSSSGPPSAVTQTQSEEEHDTYIQSWASSVENEKSEVSFGPGVKGPSLKKMRELTDAFIRIHGRKPTTLGQIWQPNNPQFDLLARAKTHSRSSATASESGSSKIVITRSASAATTLTKIADPRLHLKKVFIAKQALSKTSKVGLEILPGDTIEITKHVSGNTYFGLNRTSGQAGQFPETIIPDSTSGSQVATIEEERATALAAANRKSQDAVRTQEQVEPSPTTVYSVDNFEAVNAAAWEEAPVKRPRGAPALLSTSNRVGDFERTNAGAWNEMKTKRQSGAPTVVAEKPGAGLGASRYAVLEDEDVEDEAEEKTSAKEAKMSAEAREEMSRLVEEKFARILAAHTESVNNIPTGPRPRPKKAQINDPLKPVKPKTNICWYWATPNKSCRFTDEECRDLHSFIPNNPGDNLRMGKPTWGAAVDYLPDAPTSPSTRTETPVNEHKTQKTCWYWAQGKCQNSDEACKFLHAHCAAGVAPKPGPNFFKRTLNWSRWERAGDKKEDVGWGTGGGESSGDDVAGNEDGGWGEIGQGPSLGWGEWTPGENERGELLLEVGQGELERNTRAGDENAPREDGAAETYKAPHLRHFGEKVKDQTATW